MSAGTVWVQIGQWTCPLMLFATSAFMAFASLHPTQNWWRGLYQNRKYFSINRRAVAQTA
jgi:hypothetical protein